MKKLIISLLLALSVLCSCAYTDHTLAPYMQGDCVDRAVELRQELRKQGKDADIVLGILKHPDGTVEGHAWLRYHDPKTGKEIIIKNY